MYYISQHIILIHIVATSTAPVAPVCIMNTTSSSSSRSCHNSSVNFSCHIITSLVVAWTLCLHFVYYILHTLWVLFIYTSYHMIYIYVSYNILSTASAAAPTYIIIIITYILYHSIYMSYYTITLYVAPHLHLLILFG